MNSQMTLFAFGAKCGQAVRRRPAGGVTGESVAMQHRAERQAGEAHAEVGQKRSPRHAAASDCD